MTSRSISTFQSTRSNSHDSTNSMSSSPIQNTRQGRHRTTTSKPLNFQKAMSDFGVMFPEIDRDVIETVLRANNGVVQTTIDQLLELQQSTIIEQAECDDLRHTLPSYEASIGEDEEPPPAYSDIWEDVPAPSPDPSFIPPTLPQRSPVQITQQDRITECNKYWRAPLIGKLSIDFLRITDVKTNATASTNNHIDFRTNATPNRFNASEVTPNKTMKGNFSSDDFMTDSDIERFLEDEKLAVFLQNEEFLRELRGNREFVTSLEAGKIKIHCFRVELKMPSLRIQFVSFRLYLFSIRP